jgi:hypothetical protein
MGRRIAGEGGTLPRADGRNGEFPPDEVEWGCASGVSC